jgi:hypothetical protein
MNFHATEEELLKADIEIDDKVVRVSGGGYVGVLSVYHELHCLVRYALRSYIQVANSFVGSIKKIDFEVGQLRRRSFTLPANIHRSHYYANMTAAGLDHDDRVIEHLSEYTLAVLYGVAH